MEKIEISLLNENADKQIAMFEDFIQKQGIENLDKTEISRTESKDGQMGFGKFTNSVNAFVHTLKSLPEILKSSFTFSVKFRTDIQLKFKNIELTLKYNPEPVNNNQMEILMAKIDQLLQLKVNSLVVYGNGNIVLQDIQSSDIDIKE